MKPIAFAVLLILFLCGSLLTTAQAQSDFAQALGPAESKRAFNILSPNDPAYACINILQAARIAIFPLPGTNRSTTKITGYELAVMTARVFAILLPHPTDAQKDVQQLQQDVQDKLQKNPEAAECLLALMNEFQPEILALHQDIPAAKQRIFAINPFGDVPYNDPAFNALGVLQDAQLVKGYDSELSLAGIHSLSTTNMYSGNGKLTLYQFGVAVTEAYPLPLPDVKFAHSSADNAAKRKRADAILAANPFALEALQSLSDEFRPILDKLGQDAPTLNAHLAALAVAPPHLPLLAAQPFPDVPKDHWASEAVEALRTAGVVAGYPAGTFRADSVR